MAIFERLRVFVSSRMQELAPERQVVKFALDQLGVDTWVFEKDAGASLESTQETFLKEVERADLYVGIFWKDYSNHTIEEYEYARKLGKDCLLYEKRTDLDSHRDPMLQAFLDRIGQVETGLTVRWFNTPEELGEFVKEDVAAWQVRLVRERHRPRINLDLSWSEKQVRDQLLILLRMVKQFWVEGVLEQSIHGESLIDLGRESVPEAVEYPWEQILELPDRTRQTLPLGQPIGELFDEVERSLLILGAPGSGKTITLLDLARDLITRAESDPAQPIPVVFNLSSWTDTRQTLFDWLTEELSTKYRVPKRIGRSWLENNWLLLLLDGLDEVRGKDQRSACVEAINEFISGFGVPGLAICSRRAPYDVLPVSLKLGGAIFLQPLKPEQVKAYVARSGEALAGLRAVLAKDEVLQALVETPLMLNVMRLTYEDVSAEELVGEALDTKEARLGHLFDTYIDRMFTRKGKTARQYPREQLIARLAWLADMMHQHEQSEFLIEQMQPSWLDIGGERNAYRIGYRLIMGSFSALIFGLVGALIGGVVGALLGALVGGLLGIVTSSLDEKDIIQTIETLDWSNANARNGMRMGLVGGLMLGLIGGVSGGAISSINDLPNGLIFGLMMSIVVGVAGGMSGALFLGLSGSEAELNVLPNQGVWLSLRNAVRVWLTTGLFSGLFFSLVISLPFGPRDGSLLGLCAGFLVGFICGVLFGGRAFIKHFALRLILHFRGYFPINHPSFLDYAARLLFLRRVGGGYSFIHRLLLEHFAALGERARQERSVP